MVVVMKLSSRHTFLVLAIISLFFSNVAFSSKREVNRKDHQNGETASGEPTRRSTVSVDNDDNCQDNDCEESKARNIGKDDTDPNAEKEFFRECGYRNKNDEQSETTSREEVESQFGEFPWVVAIMVDNNGKAKFTCAGSLIDPEVVLTTAQCVKSFRRSVNKLIVRAGEWDLGAITEPIPHEERRVVKIKSHPQFKTDTSANNIALLFLDDKFDLRSTINTVCLPPQNFDIDEGHVTASGWRSTFQNRTEFQQILKSIELPFVQRSECEPMLRKGTRNRNFKLHPSFLCAGKVGTDTCTGGGSPIVFPIPDAKHSRYYAVGMVSWSIRCGKDGIPAAYTDIAYFRDWIDGEIENEGLQDHYYTYVEQDEDENIKQN